MRWRDDGSNRSMTFADEDAAYDFDAHMKALKDRARRTARADVARIAAEAAEHEAA